MNTSMIYNNPIIQYGAACILALSVLGTMVLFGFQAFTGKPFESWEQTFLITALTLAANVLGYHQGSLQTQNTVVKTLEVKNGVNHNV